MNKKYFGVTITIIITIITIAWLSLNINGGRNILPETDITSFATTTIEKRELSLDNWLSYIGTESGLKHEVLFQYPHDWYSVGAGGGGGGSQSGFQDTLHLRQEGQFYQVAYISVHGYGYLASEYDGGFATIIKKEPVIIDGWSGELVYRSVTKPGEKERREWWLILPQVGERREFPETFEYDGVVYSCDDIPCPTTTSYEIYMEDIYINSEAIFRQLIKSIEFPNQK